MRFLFFVILITNIVFAHTLKVETNPDNAHIQIVNIKPKYRDNIELKEGKYDILIRKKGYREFREFIYLDKNSTIKVDLKKSKTYKLVVNTIPSSAKVNIMNISPKYRDKITLIEGKYDILVQKKGYKTYRKWIDLDKNLVLNVKLNPKMGTLKPTKTADKSEAEIKKPLKPKEKPLVKIDENRTIKPQKAKSKEWVNISDKNLKHWKLSKISKNEIELSREDSQHRVFALFPKKSQAYDTAINKILEVFKEKQIRADITLFFYGGKNRLGFEAIDKLKKNYDLAFSVGSKSTAFLYKNFRDREVPVVSVCSKDPVLLNQVENYESSSGTNFAFTSLGIPIKMQLDYLQKLIKNLKNIVIMYSKDNKSAIKTQAMPLKELAIKNGLNIIEIALESKQNAKEELTKKVKEATEQIYNIDSDAKKSLFWITGSTSVFKEIETINQNAKNIPVVSIVPDIVKGSSDSAVLSIGVSFSSNAHLASLYAINILEQGFYARELKVGIVFPPDISINFIKAKEIGLKIPFELFEIATIIYGLDGKKIE